MILHAIFLRKGAVSASKKRFVFGLLTMLLAGWIAPVGVLADAGGSSLPPGQRTEIFPMPWDPDSLVAEDSKIIFGDDDRIDVYQETDPQRLQWAASVCALAYATDLSERSDGTFVLNPSAYTYAGYPMCAEEPFAKQPLGAFCTGFMVGTDLIATAGHCIDTPDLVGTKFIFGFAMADETTPVLAFQSNQVYTGIEIVGRKLEGDDDYAIVRVDRPITAPKATPLPIREKGAVEVGENIGIIGHPRGLPMKIAFGAETKVSENDANAVYFKCNPDGYGGNSGSPVFNANTGEVEGILVRGPQPGFTYGGTNECLVSLVVDDDFYLQVEVSKITEFSELITENQLTEANYALRAVPTLTSSDAPVVALHWENPSGDLFTRVQVLRKANGYAFDPAEAKVIYEGKENAFLDTDVVAGVTYHYTLIVYTVAESGGSELPRSDFARATAGALAPSYLTEAFNTASGTPIDLSFSQLTFSPVGAPTGDVGDNSVSGSYEMYTVSYTDNVHELPVARNDSEGGAYLLSQGEDGWISWNLNNQMFSFFGKRFSTLYIAANGYISPVKTDPNSAENFPGLDAHFANPRISFLFADLAPSVGGDIWARYLSDRDVFTYELVPEHPNALTSADLKAGTGGSTVQVELFFDGHIRITYQEISVKNAIVGLSDGNGVPVDPATVFVDAEVDRVPTETDFTAFLTQPDQLSFDFNTNAARVQYVDAGEVVEFTSRALLPVGVTGVPVLTATWTGEGAAPFGDQQDGSGLFYWQTALGDEGVYWVRVKASLDGQEAYQDVRIVVGDVLVLPEVLNLRISTDSVLEDPTQSRQVDTERALRAGYDYFHPWAIERPDMYGEGDSALYWYRDGQVVPGLTNMMEVPARTTRGDEVWHFRVTPVTAAYVVGEEYISPKVTIAAQPKVFSVSPAYGWVAGGDTVRISGARFDAVLSVTFGGVEVQSIKAISDEEIEVVTPLHVSGKVPVVVTSDAGSGRLLNGFQYITSLSELPQGDVNQDAKVNALDVQLVTNAVLTMTTAKAGYNCDVNGDGDVNALDIQVVINRALGR